MLPDTVKRVDANVQTLKQIEKSLGLPALPNEVTLDLASAQGSTPALLSSLFTGISRDFEEAQKRPAHPVRSMEIWTPQTPGLNVRERTVRGLTSIMSEDTYPFRMDERAVQHWKQRAVDKGYLDLAPREIESGRWLPEYRGIAAEMARDDMADRFSGEKAGSMSLENVLEVAEQWLTPRGLYRAALELDLFWDVEKIGTEFAQWGDKLESWKDDPWDVRKFLDMVTGPVDDIIFPALNIALMFTGVGQVWVAGRVLVGGAKAAKALNPSIVKGLYGAGGSVGRAIGRSVTAADPVADLARLGKTGLVDDAGNVLTGSRSMTSKFLEPRAGERVAPTLPGRGLDRVRQTKAAEGTRWALDSWRANSGVVMAKKVNQQAIRLGTASNVQALVDEPGQFTIANMTSADDYVNSALEMDVVDWGIDLLFTPANFFEPKAFRGIAQAFVPGHVSRIMRMSQDEKILGAFHQPVRAWVVETDPGALARFDEVAKTDVGQAMADVMAGGDKESLGGVMAYVAMHGVVDHNALELIGETGVGLHLKGGARDSWLQARGKLLAQMSHYDPWDVNRVFDVFSRHGDQGVLAGLDDGIEAVASDLIGVKGRPRLQKLFEYSPRGQTSLFPGSGPPPGFNPTRAWDSDHVRLFGHRDEAGDVVWAATARKGKDDFFTEVNVNEFAEAAGIDDLAAARALIEEAGEDFVGEWGLFLNRYRKTGLDGTARHWRMSEAHEFAPYDQAKLARLREAVGNHNIKRDADVKHALKVLADNPKLLEQYVAEVLPTFGRWNDYHGAMEDLYSLQRAGRLENARLVGPVSESGKRLSIDPQGKAMGDKIQTRIVDNLATGGLDDDVAIHGIAANGWFSPLARNLSWETSGKWSLRHVGKGGVSRAAAVPTKQEALELAHGGSTRLRRLESWRELKTKAAGQKLVEPFRSAVRGEAIEVVDPAVEDVFVRLLDIMPASDRGSLRTMMREAQKAGLDLDDFEAHLMADLHGWLNRSDWSRFRVAVDPKDQSEAAVRKLVGKLREESNMMASAIEGIPAEIVESLAARGYELVYGADFSIPREIMEGVFPQLAQVNSRQLARQRFSSHFARKDPVVVRQLKARMMRSGIYAENLRAQRGGKDVRFDFGTDPSQMTPDMERVTDILYEMSDDWQRQAQGGAETAAGAFGKIGHRMTFSRMAGGVDQLPSAMPAKTWNDKLVNVYGFTQDEANMLRAALMKSRNLGFEEMGLLSVEYAVRAQPNLINAMRLLGRWRGDSIAGTATIWASQVTGMGFGGSFAWADYMQRTDGDPDSFKTQMGATGAAIGGAAVGRMVGTQAARKMPVLKNLAGNAKFAHVEGRKFGMGAAAAAWESSPSVKHAYLADNLANLRDQVRFTLSPIFDASRYSEGILMSIMEDIPGHLANARVNMSPALYRRSVAATWLRDNPGGNKTQAAAYAKQKWEDSLAQFRAAASGDFNYDVLDGMARRYEAVGILGFSPAAWQASTYAQLLEAGVDSKKAYDTTRQIFTYGVTGRSAAELSANFIFFPFSFTKKVLGHVGRFMQQDMGRAVILTDMLTQYQVLSDHYDLEQEFKDRAPILNRAARLNVLAYGVGLGRFGGVNASMLDALGGVPGLRSATFPNLGFEDYVFGINPTIDGITNLFIPQGVNMSSADQADNVWDITRKMLPAINDVNSLLMDFMQQTQVVANDSNMTDQAEQRYGWETWRAWQDEQNLALRSMGMTWEQAMGNEQFAAIATAERVRISRQFPAWKFSFGDGIASQQAIDMEIKERVDAYLKGESADPADGYLWTFTREYEYVNEYLKQFGYSFASPENVPPQAFDLLRRRALDLAEQAPNDYARRRWLRLYGRTYRRMLGDITTELK